MLASMERVTGVRQVTCPWQAMCDPFAKAVIQAHKWWRRGQLEANHGGEIPEAIRRGLDVYDSAQRAVISHDERAEAARRAAEQASGGDAWATPRSAPRLARRHHR